MAVQDAMSTGTEANSQREQEESNYESGNFRLQNPHLKELDHDVLYHLGLATNSHDLVKMFGDVKFVCVGGSSTRMKNFANYLATELSDKFPPGTKAQYMPDQSYRYTMYKVGPVLSISHGMGVPSLQILLHEVLKLMYYAKVKDPVFFRIGTCGGIGIEGGSVVVSEGGVNEWIQPYHEQIVMGEKIQRPAKFDPELVRELASLHKADDDFNLVVGKTMCSSDFYEGQGRLDGAFCYHTEARKMDYLKKLYNAGVRNIEMEATCFFALTHLAGVRAAILCTAYLNRLQGDQVRAPRSVLTQWEFRPQQIVARYIRRHL